MIEDSPSAPQPDAGAPATSHGLPFSTALILTILCAIAAVGGSYGVLKSPDSMGAKAALSIITLIAVIGLGYSAFQLLLALVATTGERRWLARDVSERRTGERARKPRDP
ncbi:MAG: hypothetical protein H0W63_07920 [Gemmatimonadaceae bacterium]|nr:hypothetical protein [Gemmatimonadaceae bacterium]